MSQLSTTARFKCPACNQDACASVDVPEIDWCVEPLSDSLSQDDSEMVCDKCDEMFSVQVQNSPAGCYIEIYDHPNVEVDADEAPFSDEDPEDEDWLNDEPNLRPYDAYDSNRRHLADVLAEYGVGSAGVLKWSASVINRMVFSETISAMEAYLGDTLLTAVQIDSSSMQRLVTGDKLLKTERVSLSAILANPEIVKEQVQAYLRGLLYHNLNKIGVIYNIALGIDIFPDQDLKTRLHKIVLLRHDAVHRNGRNKDGIEHQFSTELVTQTMDDVHTFIAHVEKSIISLRVQILAGI